MNANRTYKRLVNELRESLLAIPDTLYLEELCTKTNSCGRIPSDAAILQRFGQEFVTTTNKLYEISSPLYDAGNKLMIMINKFDGPMPELNNIIKNQIETLKKVRNIYETLLILINNS